MEKLRSPLSNGSEKLRRGQLVGDVVELRRAAVGRAGGRSSGLKELKRGAAAGSRGQEQALRPSDATSFGVFELG